MTVSRPERRRRVCLSIAYAATLGLSLAPGLFLTAAPAQEVGPPLDIVPPQEAPDGPVLDMTPADMAPADMTPADMTPADMTPVEEPLPETAPLEAPQAEPLDTTGAGPVAPEGAEATDEPRAPEGIEVDELGVPGADYGGLLDSEAGGFGPAMWRGSARATVERYLPQVPVAASPTMQSLARRLLLSVAPGPEGEAAAADLTALRVERLMAMGRADEAEALRQAAPAAGGDGSLRQRLDALWAADDLDGACAEVAAVSDPAAQDLYWQKSLIFCQLYQGRGAEALLGLDLLREQGDGDAAFDALADRLAGGNATVLLPAEPTALHLAMQRAASVTAPAGAEATPAAISPILGDLAMAKDAAADPLLRLEAAERAALKGALPAEAVRSLYAAQPATPAELDAALAGSDPSPSRARALLYKAAERAIQPGPRATLIERALERAQAAGTYPLAVHANLELLRSVPAAPELSWFTGTAGRALYLAGQAELAAAWLQLAEREAPIDPRAADAVPLLRALDALAYGSPPPWDPQAVAAATEFQSAPGTGANDVRTSRLQAIAGVFGGGPSGDGPVAPAALAPPDAELLAGLDAAAGGGRIGETVLLALVALGPEGPGASHPEALRRALAALVMVGLDAEARALAVEAAIANGV